MLKNAGDNAFKGVTYSVFGCGSTDWAATYQQIPKMIDNKLKCSGADRICDRGIANAADTDLLCVFDVWARSVWVQLARASRISVRTGDILQRGIKRSGEKQELRTRKVLRRLSVPQSPRSALYNGPRSGLQYK